MTCKGFATLLCLTLAAPGISNAALIGNGTSVITDTSTGLMWLEDAGASGRLSWYSANDWIASLNAQSYLGYSDWRLPSAGLVGDEDWSYDGSTDWAQNITRRSAELAYLYNVALGNPSGNDINGYPAAGYSWPGNNGPFENVGPYYWLAETWDQTSWYSWIFDAHGGTQLTHDKSSDLRAWAVRGQIQDVSEVPTPGTLGLLALGMAGIGLARKRR